MLTLSTLKHPIVSQPSYLRYYIECYGHHCKGHIILSLKEFRKIQGKQKIGEFYSLNFSDLYGICIFYSDL
jgi:hypothetical protein